MTQTPSARPLVMLVDDDADSVAINAAFLQASGFDTCETSTAIHAIEMAVTRRPQAILTDVSMPFVDGWTILRTLHEHPITAHIPVVLITGYADEATRARAAAAGCFAFLAKPCEPSVMVETLRSAISSAPAPAVPALQR